MSKRKTKAEIKTEEMVGNTLAVVQRLGLPRGGAKAISVGIDPSLNGTGVCVSIPIDSIGGPIDALKLAVLQRNAIRTIQPRSLPEFYKLAVLMRPDSFGTDQQSNADAMNGILRSAFAFIDKDSLNLTFCLKHPAWVTGDYRYLVLKRFVNILLEEMSSVVDVLLSNGEFMDAASAFKAFTPSMLSRVDGHSWIDYTMDKGVFSLPVVIQIELPVVSTFFSGLSAVAGSSRIANVVAQSFQEGKEDLTTIIEVPPNPAKMFGETLPSRYARKDFESTAFLKKWQTVSAFCSAADIDLSEIGSSITDDMADAYVHAKMAAASLKFFDAISGLVVDEPDLVERAVQLSNRFHLGSFGINSLANSVLA